MSLIRAVAGVVIVGAAIATSPAGGLLPVNAQAPRWAPAYPMRLTVQRALALARAADERLTYVPGEVLIRFRDGVSRTGQQRALQALRSRPSVTDLRWVDRVAVWSDPSERDATVLAAQLQAQPEVAYAEPNYLYRTRAVPNDPGFAQFQWNLAALDMPKAWDLNPGATDKIVVAVVDTGITTVRESFTFPTWTGTAIENISVPFSHNPDLAVGRLIDAEDFVFWTGPVLDMVGHGTHVSSTVGEDTDNNLAEAGIAYNVKVMPVKVCFGFWELQFVLASEGFRGFAPLDASGCPTDAVAEGIRYAADRGAQVINLSLGGPEASATLESAVRYAVEKGAFVAIAVGNEFEDGNPIEYPAAYAANINGAMSVGAIGRSLTRAYYSNTGAHLEIAAPGGNDQDGGIRGLIWQATISGGDADPGTVIFPRFDRYFETPSAGTSMASAHVSGVAALIISQGVTKPAAVEALIKGTARDLGPAGRDDQYGFGLIQPRAMLFGFGVAR